VENQLAALRAHQYWREGGKHFKAVACKEKKERKESLTGVLTGAEGLRLQLTLILTMIFLPFYFGYLFKHLLHDTMKRKTDKKAQLSLTNPHDTKACQKLLKFDVLTTLSLTILVYIPTYSCCCVRNLRNPEKFSENSNI